MTATGKLPERNCRETYYILYFLPPIQAEDHNERGQMVT